MPRYSFKAYDATGRLHTGEISAVTRGSALEALARRAHTVVDLDDRTSGMTLPWWQREIGRERISPHQLAIFTRELASLVAASLPVDETLRILSMQPHIRSRLRQATDELLRRVTEGEQLSAAIAADRMFPEYYSHLVAAGEASGALPSVLDQLATYLERNAESRARIVSSLAYPALILVAAIVVVAVLAVVLVPAVLPIFSDAGTEPPFVIKALAALASVEPATWGMLGALFAIAVGMYAANDAARSYLDRAAQRLPVVGPLISEREAGRFARALSMLITNGVSMLDALRISGSALSSATFRLAIDDAERRVKEGEPLAAALARSDRLPALLLRLMSVGEQTGQLGKLTARAADIYEAAFQRRLERLSALATPVLTLVIGGIVGILVVSVMSAVLSMNALVLQ